MINAEDYITIANYAKLIDVSRQYINQMIKDNRLDCVIIAGRKLVNRSAVIRPALLQRGRPKVKTIINIYLLFS